MTGRLNGQALVFRRCSRMCRQEDCDSKIEPERERQLRARNVETEDAPLMPERSDGSKCFVCALPDGNYSCDRLRTYISRTGVPGPRATIWQAGRATSAAPLYFPSIEVNGQRYWGGGMHSNNPIIEVVKERLKSTQTGTSMPLLALGPVLQSLSRLAVVS